MPGVACLAGFADSPADWQEFPSLALTQSRMVMYVYPGNLTCISRPKGPQQAGSGLGYADPPFVHRTAGLDGFIETPNMGKPGFPEWTAGILIPNPFKGWGLDFNRKKTTYLHPVAAPRKAGRIFSRGIEDMSLREQAGDWAHNQVTFAGPASGEELSLGSDEELSLSITVSRLCPGLLVETGASSLGFFAGALRPDEILRVAARAAGGTTVVSPAMGEWRELPADQSWLLVFHGIVAPEKVNIAWGGEQPFPRDMGPVLIVFSSPAGAVERDDGLIFSFADSGVKAAAMPLYGLDFPAGNETEKWKTGLPDAVVERCERWAKRLAAFPVTASETYARDEARDRVVVSTRIESVAVREGAAPWTPVPPMIALACDSGMPIEFSVRPGPDDYATAYGPLRAIENTGSASWSIAGLSKYAFYAPEIGPSTPESAPLDDELGREIDKALSVPFLAPWVYETRRFGPMGDVYWRMPPETAYYLAQALPALDTERRARVTAYLDEFYERFPFLEVAAMSTWKGHKRPRHLTGVTEDGEIAGLTDSDYNYYIRLGDPGRITFSAVRGLDDYLAVTGKTPDDEAWEAAATLLNESLLGSDWATGFWTLGNAPELPPQARMTGLDIELPTKITNRHIANLVGFLRLAKRCGKGESDEAALGWGRLARELALRLGLTGLAAWVKPPHGFSSYKENPWDANRFGRNTPRIMTQFELDFRDHTQSWRQSVFPAFLDMTPELGLFMRDYAMKSSTDFLNAIDRGWPLWWIANAASEISGDSGAGLTHPVNSYSLFMARAWILGEPGATLKDRLDVPWVERGDWFFIHKLAETIKSMRTVRM